MSGSIAIITPSFYPIIGGLESYIKGLGSELVKLGYRINVYTPDRVFRKKLGPAKEIVQGIHVHRLHISVELSYRLRFWPTLHDFLFTDSNDIVHAYSHDMHAINALKAAKELSLPFVLTTYGPFSMHSDYGLVKQAMLKLYDRLVTPNLFRNSELILVRYPELMRWVCSFGVDLGKIGLEPSGFPSSYMQPAEGDRIKNRLGVDGPILLYLGRISPQKGLKHLLISMKKVAQHFSNATLLLVGPDYTNYSTYLKRLAMNLGIEDKVIFYKPVEDESEEKELLASCDIFVMPSSFEGFSQAVAKAMAQSKPVVATSVGGLPYEVGYGSCGILIRYGDHKGMADAIIGLLKDEVRMRVLGEAARRRALLFTFEKLALRMSEVYKKLMN